MGVAVAVQVGVAVGVDVAVAVLVSVGVVVAVSVGVLVAVAVSVDVLVAVAVDVGVPVGGTPTLRSKRVLALSAHEPLGVAASPPTINTTDLPIRPTLNHGGG